MTEPFDWSVVDAAARWWMEFHDTPPKYLLLPEATAEEIQDLAEDIYHVPVKRVDIPLARFDDEVPRAWLSGPIFAPPPPKQTESFAALVERAKRGEITDQELQRMNMESYAAIRHILIPRMQAATEGKSFAEVWKLFVKREETLRDG